MAANQIGTSGTLTISDPDSGESSFQAGTVNGAYGDLTIDAAGNWTYTADNTQAAIQQLDVSESITDTLTVTSFDGTTHNVVITLYGTEDAAVIAGTASGSVTEDGPLTTSGALTISDTDASDSPSFADVAATASDNGYGTFEMNGGTWTYTLNNAHPAVQALAVSETLSDTYTVTAADGSTQQISITITGAAEAAAPPPLSLVEPPMEPEPAEAVPETEPEAVSKEAAESVGEGGNEAQILEEITALPQDTRQPSPQNSVVFADFGRAETESEKPAVRREVARAEPAAAERPGSGGQVVNVQGLAIDQLALQVSDDEALNLKFEAQLLERIDLMTRAMDDEAAARGADGVEVSIVMGSTATITAGIVSWVLRGGSLLASLMGTMPLLNRFDPLPIVKQKEEKEDVTADDDSDETESRERARRVDALFSGHSDDSRSD